MTSPACWTLELVLAVPDFGIKTPSLKQEGIIQRESAGAEEDDPTHEVLYTPCTLCWRHCLRHHRYRLDK